MNEFVTSVMRDPRVWSSVAEDGMDRESFEQDPAAEYVLHERGFLMFRPVTTVMWEVHIAMLHGAKGVDAFVAKSMQVMRDRGVQSFLAVLPSWNRAGIAVARRNGFRKVGQVENAYRRDGALHAMILLGRT